MNLFSALSLRTKLLILLLTLPVVTLGTYLALATRLFKSDKIAYIFDSSSSVSNTLAAQIASEIQVFKMRAFPVLDGYQPEQKTFDKTAQGIFQKEAVFLNSTIYQIINADKQIRFESVASLEKPGIENPIAKWSQTDLDLLLTDARNHHMAIRSGIEKEGEWVAVALDKENSSYVSLNVFSAINFRSFFEKSHSYQTYLVDSNGHVLISPSSKNEGELSVVKNFSEWKFFRDLKGKTMPAGTTEALDPAGNSVLVSYSRVGSGNLMVVSIVDKEVALGAIKVLVTKSILFLVLLKIGRAHV